MRSLLADITWSEGVWTSVGTVKGVTRLSDRFRLGAVFRGLAAGAVGTVAMTGWQELAGRLESHPDRPAASGSPTPQDPWEQAPVPAKVGRVVVERVLSRPVSPDLIPLLTNVMHWSYGIGWGGVYGVLANSVPRASKLGAGPYFGAGVWAMSYVELVPLGLYQPPWRYSAKDVALDLSYHLVYGTGTSVGWRLLGRAR